MSDIAGTTRVSMTRRGCRARAARVGNVTPPPSARRDECRRERHINPARRVHTRAETWCQWNAWLLTGESLISVMRFVARRRATRRALDNHDTCSVAQNYLRGKKHLNSLARVQKNLSFSQRLTLKYLWDVSSPPLVGRRVA